MHLISYFYTQSHIAIVTFVLQSDLGCSKDVEYLMKKKKIIMKFVHKKQLFKRYPK